MASISEKFASYSKNLKFDQLPDEVIHRAKMCVLDCFSNMLASGAKFSKKKLMSIMNNFAEFPEATVFGAFRKMSCMDAAFLNSIMARFLDIDDGNLEARGHPGTVLVPSAFALGEKLHKSGKDLLTSLVIGYDVYLKLGKLINPIHRNRGFDSTGTVGVCSASAVGSSLMGLSKKKIVSAFGIAGSLAAGLNEYHSDGSMTKILHSGFASRNGLFASMLSKANITGPKTVFEGKEGFIHALVGDVNETHQKNIIKSIGKDYEILNLYFKRYGCLRRTHTVVDGAIYLAEKHKLNVNEIKKVEVHTSSFVSELGTKTPKTLVDAQGNIPFCVALALNFRKAGIGEFSLDNLKNSRLISLSKKVSLHIDPDFEKKFQQNQQSPWSSRVIVILRSGRTYSHTVIYPSGDPQNPIPDSELMEKFNDMVSLSLSDPQKERLKEMILNFENIKNLAVFYQDFMEEK
jgi:2-methylcitrate dehydratase PrpD